MTLGSGGMLLNSEGVVLGMVTSNVRHTPPPSSDDDMATRKAKEKQSEEGGALLVELNFSMPLVALEHLLTVAGIFEPEVREPRLCRGLARLLPTVATRCRALRLFISYAPDDAVCRWRACCSTLIAYGPQNMQPHTFLDLEIQAELDTPDDQLAALWALNLEQEELYQV